MYIYHRKNINMFIILIKLWHVYFADSKVGTEKIYVLLFQIAEKLFVFFFFYQHKFSYNTFFSTQPSK